MSIFFTSDYHFFHHNIIKYSGRPFSDVYEMNQEIIARHNAVVLPGDTVYNLGDFTFKENQIPQLLIQLNGNQILIPGNHDQCHPCHKKYQNARERYLKYGFKDLIVDGIDDLFGFQINHMPFFDACAKDQRYPEYRPKQKGNRWLLHGHVHEKWRVKERMINVGVDQWDYKPVGIETLIQIRDKGN